MTHAVAFALHSWQSFMRGTHAGSASVVVTASVVVVGASVVVAASVVVVVAAPVVVVVVVIASVTLPLIRSISCLISL